MKKIGILGGMGPRATVQFEQMLIDKMSGSDQDIPAIISINDGSIPDRSAFLLGYGEDPVPKLVSNGLILQNAGVDIICIPCNTACAPGIFDRLVSCLDVPVINLPEKVVERVKDLNLGRVCLMGTVGTIQSGNYQRLLNLAGVDFDEPSPQLTQLIQGIIDSVKSADMPTAYGRAAEVAGRIDPYKFGAAILGCTELPFVKDALVPSGVMAINTLEVLVNSTLDMALEPSSQEMYATR